VAISLARLASLVGLQSADCGPLKHPAVSHCQHPAAEPTLPPEKKAGGPEKNF